MSDIYRGFTIDQVQGQFLVIGPDGESDYAETYDEACALVDKIKQGESPTPPAPKEIAE